MSVPAEELTMLLPTEVEDAAPTDPMSSVYRLRELVDMENIAEDLSDDELTKIGARCVAEYEFDCESRQEWLDSYEEGLKLATQIMERKNWPWDGAANVKFPLISEAAITFSARAYPELIKNDIVKGEVTGADPENVKHERAERVSTFQTWQLRYRMPYWEEETDSLLIQLPLAGVVFRKVYNDPLHGPQSRVVRAKDLVVNHKIKSFELLRRETEVMEFSHNMVEEKMRAGEWRRIDLPSDESEDAPSDDKYSTILEQHRWLDLDGDGYEEPYIVTLHESSAKVLRIVARFDPNDVVFSEDADRVEIIKIKPIRHYIKYGFIPNPDGGLYDTGLCHLLLPISESINSTINQLLDAGTLSNTQGGLIAKGIRIKGGKMSFSPGEWKFTDSSGMDLKNSIYPLPVREPSSTLFNLLGLLIDSGRALANIKDVLQGDLPNGNVPATTVLALIEQGQKVYSGIYKRIHRAMGKEFKAIYRLNSEAARTNPEFLQMYAMVLDRPDASPDDFNQEDYDICPAADPNVSSQAQRIARAQVLLPLKDEPGANKGAILTEYVASAGYDSPERFYDAQAAQQASQAAQTKQDGIERMQLELEGAVKQAEANLKNAQAEKTRIEALMMQAEDGAKEIEKARIDSATEIERTQIQEAAETQRQQLKIQAEARLKELEFTIKESEAQAKNAESLLGEIKSITEEAREKKEGASEALVEGLKSLIEGQSAMMNKMSKPRKTKAIRDENGRLIGAEDE